MPRRRSTFGLAGTTAALVAGILATGALQAPPTGAADANETVSTLTTVMKNFDAQPAKRYRVTTDDGVVWQSGWRNDRRRAAYDVSYGFDGSKSRTVELPYVYFLSAPGRRCWYRKRSRYRAQDENYLDFADMNTAQRLGPTSIRVTLDLEGSPTPMTVEYDSATLLPARLEVEVNGLNDDGTPTIFITAYSYSTPSKPPKPGRICRR